MNVSGLRFYPLHVNVMNLPDNMQDFMSSDGHTIPVFLPVDFFHMPSGLHGEDNNVGRLGKLRNVHHVIGKFIEPLGETAVRSIQYMTG